ncbi:MAG: polysaccharide biosynthesis protein [Microbacteriaceae bacterium]|nr:polysaccharide biosynthesis protein [Microbacteriaceae bacterium]
MHVGPQFLLDVLAWTLAIVVAGILRFDFDPSRVGWVSTVMVVLLAVVVHFVAGWIFALYRGRFRAGTFEEVRALVGATAVVAVVLTGTVLGFGTQLGVPRSSGLIAFPFALIGMFAVRYVQRVKQERQRRPGAGALRTIVFGAGYLGESLVRRMSTDPLSEYLPVGLIDDDPAKRHLQIRTVPVLGTLAELESIVERTGAEALIVAVGRADASLLRSIADAGAQCNLTVKVLPPLNEMVAGVSGTGDIRDISIEDLIGRQPVDTEVASIAGYLSGRRVLVTGAGGSIGSELCRQISKYGPAELIMLDHDETGLQSTQLVTRGHGLLNTSDVVLADVRDEVALKKIFAARCPDVVFHAAAMKHLPMLEQYPDEAWKTNVLGTLNVLQAAIHCGVSTFVNISTDKAANPTSVLGHSKRVAEKLTVWAAEQTGLNYLSVRFGNVIGSRGSMLPTFTYLIEHGGPVTVTHPDMTRFFMTIPEACQLVVQAGGIGRPGEVLILDMGEPVRILEVAERMIEMSGKRIDIVFTGLREGEKLQEELVGVNELTERPFHPRIMHTRIHSILPENVEKAEWEARLVSTELGMTVSSNVSANVGTLDSAL